MGWIWRWDCIFRIALFCSMEDSWVWKIRSGRHVLWPWCGEYIRIVLLSHWADINSSFYSPSMPFLPIHMVTFFQFCSYPPGLFDIFLLATYGSAVGLTPETAPLLPASTIHDFTIGAKALFTAWICYISLTWCLKAVLLVLYTRLTYVTRFHIASLQLLTVNFS